MREIAIIAFIVWFLVSNKSRLHGGCGVVSTFSDLAIVESRPRQGNESINLLNITLFFSMSM